MIRRNLISRLAASGAVAACALLGSSGSALAASSCTNLGTAGAVFSPFGDAGLYSSVPGGSFETGQTNKWVLSKDTIVKGNEPWHVGGSKDTQSLQLVSGGSAVSPAMCISAMTPTWRFFARAGTTATASTLSMWATWKASDGTAGTTPVVTIPAAGFTIWQPTPVLALGSLLPADTTGTANLHMSTTGKWQVDDVYIDPYSRG